MEAALDKLLQDAVAAGVAPSIAAAVAKDGQMLYEKVFGSKRLDGSGSVELGHGFRIMSMTKMITSVGVRVGGLADGMPHL